MIVRRVTSLLGALLLMSAVQAQEIAGVRVPDQVVIGDTPLRLNGAGVRTYLLFNVYVAALYLPQRADTTRSIIEAPTPKCIDLHFLRDVGGADVVDMLLQRFQAHASAAAYAQLHERLDSRRDSLPDLRAGDVLRLAFVDNERTEVRINGRLHERFYGQEFQTATLQVWLGENVGDEALKQAMLGNRR